MLDLAYCYSLIISIQLSRTEQLPSQSTTYIINMSTYKPTEHDGLKQDGTQDKRVGTGEFAQGKVKFTLQNTSYHKG